MKYFKWQRKIILVIIFAGVIFSAQAAPVFPSPPDAAGQQQQQSDGMDKLVSVDFNNVDLSVFIKFISEITGTNFVIDEHVRDKVTIISPTKISIDKAYQVFESVLEVYGYTTVVSGEVTKIVKAMDARTKNIETRLTDEAATPDDKVVTQVIQLAYADADEVKRLFAPFVDRDSVVLSYDSTNMLIITDVSSNIRRLQRILSVIDVPGHGKHLSVITLDYADASKMVPILENVFQSTRTKREQGPAERMKLVADERANAIILVASEAETRRIKELIRLLDKKVPQGKEKIHVYYLKNADAEELMKVLQTFPGKKGEAKAKPSAPVISEDVSISADAATNSLIIMADRDDYLILEDIIEKLDIPRSMVFIECLIAEVNVDQSFDLGVEWMAGGEASYEDKEGVYGGGFGGSGYPNLMTTLATGMFPAGFSLGAFGETIQVGDVVFPTVGALIQALKKDKDVHILSTPQIMTTDNEEATITVGKNIPYLTKIGTTSTTETYSNYEYKDVGISLTIKPQINENRLIRLALKQEVTRLDVGSTFSAERPSTLKRTVDTNVIVHDGHTIVIGGLIDDSLSKVEYRVPCLGKIPGLGWLFKTVSNSDVKTNLFVFLTPHVVKTVGEAEDIFKTKKEAIERVTDGSIQMFPDATSVPATSVKEKTPPVVEMPVEDKDPTPEEQSIPDKHDDAVTEINSGATEEAILGQEEAIEDSVTPADVVEEAGTEGTTDTDEP